MSSNVGFYPGQYEWFTMEKLAKYSLWATFGLMGLGDKNIFYICKWLHFKWLCKYRYNIFDVASWPEKPQIITVWPLKKTTFCKSLTWILFHLLEVSWFLFPQAVSLAKLKLLVRSFLWRQQLKSAWCLPCGDQGQLEIRVDFTCRSLGFQAGSFLPLCSDLSTSKTVNFCLSRAYLCAKAAENHFLVLLPVLILSVVSACSWITGHVFR